MQPRKLLSANWPAQALRFLCKTGKERFTSYIDSAPHFTKTPCTDGSGNYEIRRIDTDAPPRIVGPSHGCDCEESVAHEGSCRHKVRMDDLKFVLTSWPERFHLQKTLGKSYYTGTPTDASAVSGSQALVSKPGEEHLWRWRSAINCANYFRQMRLFLLFAMSAMRLPMAFYIPTN
jgi:hypothetical protein